MSHREVRARRRPPPAWGRSRREGFSSCPWCRWCGPSARGSRAAGPADPGPSPTGAGAISLVATGAAGWGAGAGAGRVAMRVGPGPERSRAGERWAGHHRHPRGGGRNARGRCRGHGRVDRVRRQRRGIVDLVGDRGLLGLRRRLYRVGGRGWRRAQQDLHADHERRRDAEQHHRASADPAAASRGARLRLFGFRVIRLGQRTGVFQGHVGRGLMRRGGRSGGWILGTCAGAAR